MNLYYGTLYCVYGKEFLHTVEDDRAKGELADYNIKIRYPPKLNCSEEELVSEFNSIWPIVNKAWLQVKTSSSSKKDETIKDFWIQILNNHAIEYPNLCNLILLLLSISPGTGPLERSFSKLAKICYKDRNSIKADTLEALYLLSSLDIKGNDDELLDKLRVMLKQ